MKVSLKLATPSQVKVACLRYHYAKSVPSSQVAFSCYEEDKFIGVIIFGSGANNNIAKSYGLHQGQVLELVRVALNQKAHTQPTTQYVAIALKLLKKVKPLCKIVISYADLTNQGHTGTIYRAGNWLYMGTRSTGKDAYYYVDGKLMHGRSLRQKYGSKQQALLKHKVVDAPSFTKHLYVVCLSRDKRQELESKAVPFQGSESGAIPTLTHQ